jgi:cardiolipin synthase A/B
MERMYLDDLNHASEIVLVSKRKLRPAGQTIRRPPQKRLARGNAGRAAAGLLRLGNTMGAAITSRRPLGSSEMVITLSAAAVLLCIAIVAILWPWAISWPVVILCFWVAASLLIKAFRLFARRRM